MVIFKQSQSLAPNFIGQCLTSGTHSWSSGLQRVLGSPLFWFCHLQHTSCLIGSRWLYFISATVLGGQAIILMSPIRWSLHSNRNCTFINESLHFFRNSDSAAWYKALSVPMTTLNPEVFTAMEAAPSWMASPGLLQHHLPASANPVAFMFSKPVPCGTLLLPRLVAILRCRFSFWIASSEHWCWGNISQRTSSQWCCLLNNHIWFSGPKTPASVVSAQKSFHSYRFIILNTT